MLYAIRIGTKGPIKIGRAGNPVMRMAELQTAHPEPLNLLAAVRWPDAMELELHKALGDSRLLGEWFKPSEPVMWVVEKMRDFDACHEVMARFFPDHGFPWMAYAYEPLSAEYMADLIERTPGAPIKVVSMHGKWPAT